MDQPETPANDHRPAKLRLHILGRGIGRDIKVFGGDPEQEIPHSTADQIGFETGPLQGFADLDGVGGDEVSLQSQICAAQDLGLTWFGEAGSAAQEPVEKSVDHSKSRRTGQPDSRAAASRRGSGLVATGSVTWRNSGRSFMESL